MKELKEVTEDWQPPRCIHGHILLGCPDETCPTQNAYLEEQNKQMAAWNERQRMDARRIVRTYFGLPEENNVQSI